MPYALSDIVLNSGHANEVVVHQITNLQNPTNINLVPVKGTGGITPVGHVQSDAEPQSSITTTDTSLLALRSNRWLAAGYCADDAASIIPFNKRANCGTFDETAVHSALTCANMMVVPTSISGQGSNPVEINSELRYIAADRHTNPVTKLSSQALRTSAYQETSEFGKAFIKGVLLPDVTGFTFTPGFTITRDSFGGYATQVFITATESTFEFTVEDLDRAMDAIAASDTAAGGGTILYLQKQKAGASVELPTATVHKSITALSGSELTETISATDGQNGTGTIKVVINNPNGANSGDLVTVATGVAIP